MTSQISDAERNIITILSVAAQLDAAPKKSSQHEGEEYQYANVFIRTVKDQIATEEKSLVNRFFRKFTRGYDIKDAHRVLNNLLKEVQGYEDALINSAIKKISEDPKCQKLLKKIDPNLLSQLDADFVKKRAESLADGFDSIMRHAKGVHSANMTKVKVGSKAFNTAKAKFDAINGLVNLHINQGQHKEATQASTSTSQSESKIQLQHSDAVHPNQETVTPTNLRSSIVIVQEDEEEDTSDESIVQQLEKNLPVSTGFSTTSISGTSPLLDGSTNGEPAATPTTGPLTGQAQKELHKNTLSDNENKAINDLLDDIQSKAEKLKKPERAKGAPGRRAPTRKEKSNLAADQNAPKSPGVIHFISTQDDIIESGAPKGIPSNFSTPIPALTKLDRNVNEIDTVASGAMTKSKLSEELDTMRKISTSLLKAQEQFNSISVLLDQNKAIPSTQRDRLQSDLNQLSNDLVIFIEAHNTFITKINNDFRPTSNPMEAMAKAMKQKQTPREISNYLDSVLSKSLSETELSKLKTRYGDKLQPGEIIGKIEKDLEAINVAATTSTVVKDERVFLFATQLDELLGLDESLKFSGKCGDPYSLIHSFGEKASVEEGRTYLDSPIFSKVLLVFRDYYQKVKIDVTNKSLEGITTYGGYLWFTGVSNEFLLGSILRLASQFKESPKNSPDDDQLLMKKLDRFVGDVYGLKVLANANSDASNKYTIHKIFIEMIALLAVAEKDGTFSSNQNEALAKLKGELGFSSDELLGDEFGFVRDIPYTAYTKVNGKKDLEEILASIDKLFEAAGGYNGKYQDYKNELKAQMDKIK